MSRQKSPLVRPPRFAEAGRIASMDSAGRGGRRVEITLESGTTYLVDANVAYDAGIAPGIALEQAEVQALLDADDLLAAKGVATRQLSYRPRSVTELRQTLAQRGFGQAIIDQVIERFTELGYLDDADFARRWVANREQLAPRGTRLLKQELRQKGIGADLADEVIADADLDELDSAIRIAERRLPKMAGLDRDTQRRRLAGYLERRGFSHEVVRKVDRTVFSRES
jgi:regulatory protein